MNIGFTLLKLDSLDEALNIIIPTLRKISVNSSHEKYLHWESYKELISYHWNKKNFKEAKHYLPQLEEFSYDELHKDILPKFVYEVEKGLGNHKVALDALERYQLYLLEEQKKIETNNIEGMKSQVALQEQTAKLQKAELDKLRSENAKQNQLRGYGLH